MSRKTPQQILKDYKPEIPGKGISVFCRALFAGLEASKPAKYTYLFNKNKMKGKQVLILACHASHDDYIHVIRGYKWANPNIVTGFHSMLENGVFKLMMRAGVIPKPLYEPYPAAVKNIIRLVKEGASILLFPEGIQSMNGHSQPLQPQTAKLVKKLGLDVVLVKSKGAYLAYPRYDPKPRKGRVEYIYEHLLTAEALKVISELELENLLAEKMRYNDFVENETAGFEYKSKRGNANNLENLLIVCPKCLREFTMRSDKNSLTCECGFKALVDDRYSLTFPNESAPFTRIDEWYDWQVDRIREEIRDPAFSISYKAAHNTFDMSGKGSSMKKNLGRGILTLTCEGISYKGDDCEEAVPPWEEPQTNPPTNGVELFFPISKIPSAPFIGGRGNEFYFKNCYHEFIIEDDDRRKAVKFLIATELLHNETDETRKQLYDDIYKNGGLK